MFSGIVRDNLDPFAEYDDAAVWRALEDASLKDMVQSDDDGLQMSVDENGSNFSVGQRQMIGIARALLKRSKVIIMDEATANIDVETDATIQRAMRTRFQACTCITIARKSHSLANCVSTACLSDLSPCRCVPTYINQFISSAPHANTTQTESTPSSTQTRFLLWMQEKWASLILHKGCCRTHSHTSTDSSMRSSPNHDAILQRHYFEESLIINL